MSRRRLDDISHSRSMMLVVRLQLHLILFLGGAAVFYNDHGVSCFVIRPNNKLHHRDTMNEGRIDRRRRISVGSLATMGSTEDPMDRDVVEIHNNDEAAAEIPTTMASDLKALGWQQHFANQLLIGDDDDDDDERKKIENMEGLVPVRITEVRSKSIHVVGGGGIDHLIPITQGQKIINENDDKVVVAGDWLLVEDTMTSSSSSSNIDSKPIDSNNNVTDNNEKTLKIRNILIRKSVIKRKAPGRNTRKKQLIASNLDTVFIVSSCNQDFNVARLERYIAMVLETVNVEPVVVLTKKDLLELTDDDDDDDNDDDNDEFDEDSANTDTDSLKFIEWVASASVADRKEFMVGKKRRLELHGLCEALQEQQPGLLLTHDSLGTGRSRTLSIQVVSKPSVAGTPATGSLIKRPPLSGGIVGSSQEEFDEEEDDFEFGDDDDDDDLEDFGDDDASSWLLDYYRDEAKSIADGTIPVVCLDARNGQEASELLRPWLEEGQTVAFVGSSGVGKSTLVNSLCGTLVAKTGDIHTDSGQGRHTTSRRQLHFLRGNDTGDSAQHNHQNRGCAILDTPGLRELQLVDAAQGLSEVFQDLVELSRNCKFNDCQHSGEPGCAIEAALETGDLDPSRLARWEKLVAEDAANTRDVEEGRIERERKRNRKAKTKKSKPRADPEGRNIRMQGRKTKR